MVAERESYAATASAFDLFSAPARPARLAALGELLPLLRPEEGPILDVGAGSAAAAAVILDRVPSARVMAIEPSRSMRSLALGRIAEHPEWFERITVHPEDFFSADLPRRLGGALALGVIGHFDGGERRAVLAELAARLPRGGGALLDLLPPARPTELPAEEFTAAVIGDLTYRCIAEAWPAGGADAELMRWRMTYLTLEGERVVVEDVAEFDYRHPEADVLVAEAADVGLSARRVDGAHWLLVKG
ncbi:hypothetical protein NBM05_01165 [Rothia sp. AR01]|uniref:Methyltransferase domain-containing protein n=1 Tax=Rothia santali TaxID=2949643 RepID=A0A9X2HBJ7_9MICC|nr:methyltransferase domain-containing protein [Rothia santali]MCP3424677.1 hypothetical protein [Rothia santali]